ncbi:MAG: glycoside hydrolase family 88 protein [Gaiellales bacterium]
MVADPAAIGNVAVDPRIVRAADQLLRHPYERWFYGDSIGFEALVKASTFLGSERWASFAHGFARSWAVGPPAFREIDNTAPGHAICLLYETSSDDLLLDVALRLADYLRARHAVSGVYAAFEDTKLMRPYGGGRLPPQEVALLRSAGPGVFVDCLHFDPPFFVHLGLLTEDDELVSAGVAQAQGYVDLLQDDGGLFYHFYLERTARPYILGWSRGQGWALLGLLDIVAMLGSDDRARPLAEAALRLGEAMLATQKPDGDWWAVAQRATSGDESSTAAFMATAFARGSRLGLYDERFLDAGRRAWTAALRNTGPDGVLTGTSAAVHCSTLDDHYDHVPRGFTVPWGQGPLVLAAAEWTEDT